MPSFSVFEDNQGAVQLAKSPVTSSNSKHIDVRHHCFKELVHQGHISVTHAPSEYQQADILTKTLVYDIFVAHRNFLTDLSE